MEITCRLAPLVFYDNYDDRGYLLAIKQGVLVELNEHETQLLNALLYNGPTTLYSIDEAEVMTFLQRLQDQHLIEPESRPSPTFSPSHTPALRRWTTPSVQSVHSGTWRQRFRGGIQIITIIGLLCSGEQGLYQAYCFLWNLKKNTPTTTITSLTATKLVGQEYWFYRLILGLIERRAAHLIGQQPGNESLCLIRSLALCAYLLSFGMPVKVIIARPHYGSCDGFRLHVWVEFDDGTPLNEHPNVGLGYRRLASFPEGYC